MIITLTSKIDNASLQVGDAAYYVNTSALSAAPSQLVGSNLTLIGNITMINASSIEVDSGSTEVPVGSFIVFSKDNRVNNSGLKGYYASVKMKHGGSNKAELFAVSSEVTESSK
jgi:hypothetical protein